MKTIAMAFLFALPGLAQQRLLPSPTTTIAELPAVTTPPRAGSFLGNADRVGVPGKSLYGWSVAALVSANVADVASSWNQTEANPALGRNAQFGVGSMAIKSGLVGTTLALEYIALRHRPDIYKRLAWLNFGASGALSAVAAHNMSLR